MQAAEENDTVFVSYFMGCGWDKKIYKWQDPRSLDEKTEDRDNVATIDIMPKLN